MNKSRVLLFSGIGLMSIGLMLSINPIREYWRSKHVESVNTSPFSVVASAAPALPQPPKEISGHPVRIRIPSRGIDLKVVDGYYNSTNKTWTLTNNMAHHGTMTPEPNNKQGNTFIYAHNRKGVFEGLNKMNIGDEAIVTTDNGHTFTYKFRVAYETNPKDNSLFSYEGAPILTLQTCSGVWYQNRQLFIFDLIGVL